MALVRSRSPWVNGLGDDSVTIPFPWVVNGCVDETTGAGVPCESGNRGGGASSGGGPAPGAMCLAADFPFIGTQKAGGCVPVVQIPSPWGTVLAVLVGLGIAAKVVGGRR